MESLGSNIARVGSYNQRLVLSQVRRAKVTSRVELAQATGLSAQTVGNIVRKLLSEGLLEVCGTEMQVTGKPRELLRLQAGGAHAFGVHLDPSLLTVVAVDLEGSIRCEESYGLDGDEGPERVLEMTMEAIRRMFVSKELAGRRLGIGLAVPGPVDIGRGEILSPPHLPRWEGVPIVGLLKDLTGMPVWMAKDVMAAVTALRWLDAGLGDDLVLVYIGTGIGLGLVSGGSIVKGFSGNAGQVGHVVVDASADVPICECGQVGCVAQVLAPSALVARAVAAGIDINPAHISLAAALGEVVDVAQSGDVRALSLMESVLTGLSQLVRIAVDFIDADHVAFTGPLWPQYRRVMKVLGRELHEIQAAAGAVHVVETELDRHEGAGIISGALGAGIMVLDQELSPHPENLFIQL